MERKKFLVGMGAASAVGSAVLGSGAFSRVESDRYFGIEVAEDPDAYLGLDACDSANGDRYAAIDDDGHLAVDIGEGGNGNGGQGVNTDSRTWFDDVFQVCNQGSDTAYVWIDDSDDWPVVEEGPDAGNSRVDFYVSETDESMVGADNALELAVGQCQCLGIQINTHGIDASTEETLLSEVGDRLTIVADTEPPEGQPNLANFEVSQLSPMMTTVSQGESFAVSATVTNTGEYSGEQTVDLVVDDSVVDSQSVSLEPGEAQEVSFEEIATADREPGEYTHTVASEDTDASGTLVVEELAAVFEVGGLEPAEATVTPGDPLTVSATVSNTGATAGEQDLALSVDDEVIDMTTLSLDAGAESTVTFEDVATDDLAEGEYTYAIGSDDDASGTLTVEEEDDGEVQWHRDLDVPVNAEEATNWDNYEVHNLGSEASGELMAISVDPAGRIWYIGRGAASFPSHGDDVAQICYVDPATGEHTVALELDVIVGSEELTGGGARELGGQSVVVDPDFEENGYVYVYYHPSSENLEFIDNPYHEDITTGLQRVSRFEFGGDVLDPESEEVIIEIPFQLETCCHYGRYLEFGPEGNLWISTGDDSDNVENPDDEMFWSMTDEREGYVAGRPAPVSDAQRTSGNTADLRGSVLRISPTADGGYEIPDGNLKEWWEQQTGDSYDDDDFRPELYVMGLRNPFTLTVDDHTGFVFIANYGNGASYWDPALGPAGQATYHLFCEPGNAGHPFFKGYYPTRNYDFDAGEPGQPFWPDNLRNRSRNNTGIEDIPNVEPALLWHPQGFDTYTDVAAWADMPRPGEITWPELDQGGSADAGIAYRYSEDFGEGALDPYFEGTQFIMNPSNADNIRYLTYNSDGSLEIDEFLPENPISSAYDMELLPDGRLVILGMYSGIHVVEYQGPPPEWEAPPEEAWPDRVDPGAGGLGGDPPGDATILWDGDTATLDDWEHSGWAPDEGEPNGADPQWAETDGYFETVPGAGDIRPAKEGLGAGIGDCHLHLEWMQPEGVDDTGNSGLFMMEAYEIQIIDDSGWSPEQLAGTYYTDAAPHDLPLRPRGEWNEFDIFWRTPQFDDGEVVRRPQLTVFFNGVPTVFHYDVPGPNWGGVNPFDDDELGHPTTADGEFATEWPFFLQEHGDVVRFRNVWYRDLPERPVEIDDPEELPEYDTSDGGTDAPARIDAGGPGTTGEPPEDAEILIDQLSLEPGAGDWESDAEYGDCQLHLEYRIPEDVDGEGPWRGSSGVLMMGDYELNIVDTHENPVEADEWAGAYTHQNGPHHDAVRDPGEWQQLDILWQAPRFVGGDLAKPAQVTALLNGVAVQTRLEVAGPNDRFTVGEYSQHGEQPLRLREDGSQIEFANTWIRPYASDELVEEGGENGISVPYALDAGGSETAGDVVIDGVAFDRSPAENEFVSTTGNRGLGANEWHEFDGTEHDLLYASELHGEAFGFEIAIENGTYDVTLHLSDWDPDEFAEGVVLERVQDVSLQGEDVLSAYNIPEEAGGGGVAHPVTFEDVEVTEGVLAIDFAVHPDSEDPYAKLNGLEIHEGNEGVSVPYGLDAGGTGTEGDVVIDGVEFDRSPAENEFVTPIGDPTVIAHEWHEFDGTEHDLLYASELHGESFGFEIAIENGTYDLTLHLSDWDPDNFDGWDEVRVQDVSLQGEDVLSAYNIPEEAGGGGVAHPVTFEDIEVTEGVLTVDFAVHPDGTEPYAKLNGLEIHEATDSGTETIEPGTAIELEGVTDGWVGTAPDDLAGETNPTLDLVAGETYELGWTTGDDRGHNIEIRDTDDTVVDDLETEVTSDPGDGQWLTFEASDEMVQYVCNPHQSLMKGDINVL